MCIYNIMTWVRVNERRNQTEISYTAMKKAQSRIELAKMMANPKTLSNFLKTTICCGKPTESGLRPFVDVFVGYNQWQ